jgi:hypothetical protein
MILYMNKDINSTQLTFEGLSTQSSDFQDFLGIEYN